MPKDYNVDDILKEYSGETETKEPPKPSADSKINKIQDTGFIPIPSGKSGDLEQTAVYNITEAVEINAPEKKPSPSHKSGKFQVSDISRPNVSYINSVKEVIKNPADLPPRATDEITDYDGAVVTKTASDKEYIPKVRRMSDSTRAKEMRSKRKKKKQPEFTYERETPDGVYTKPQKKKKKFVVSHNESKPKSADKRTVFDLSSSADPKSLDIPLEPSVPLRSVNTDEPGYYERDATIKDYDSFEDPKEIRRSITELGSALMFRSFVLFVLFIISAVVALGDYFTFPALGFLSPENPRIFSGVMFIFVLLSMAVSLDTVKSGLLKLLNFRADTDSLAAFAGLFGALTALSSVLNSGPVESGDIHLYSCIAIMTMLFNAVGKRLILKRSERNFEFAAREKNKYAVFCVEDEVRAESLTRGTVGDFPILAGMKKIGFIKDFSKYTFSTDSADRLCKVLAPLLIIASAAATAAVTFIKHRGFDLDLLPYTLSIFTLYISACSCMAMPLTANIPLGKAARKYSKNHGVILGYQGIEELYDVNSVMTDALELFPTGSISLRSIKLFSDAKIDDALLDAASLTSYADSVLREIFTDVVVGKEMILKKVENFVYEEGLGLCGWIDNKRILLGNRDLMRSHNIEGVPTKTKEAEFIQGSGDALYLSVSGNLSALLIIDITASGAVLKAMKALEKKDMPVIIKSVDPFITKERISDLFGISKDLLKIIPANMIKEYDAETKKELKTSTAAACSGKFSSFVNLIMSAKTMRKTAFAGVFIQGVSALLGFGIVSIYCVLNAFSDLSPAWLIVYNAICTLLTVLAVGIKKV